MPADRSVVANCPEWVDQLVDRDRCYTTDEDRMRLAIELARQNVLRGSGGPFGAVVFEMPAGRVVSIGVNSVARLQNSALHAEILAVMLAQRAIGCYTLRGVARHELVTSCDPCAMCLGAVLWSGVQRLVTGASREDASALQFDEGPVFPESYAYLMARGVEVARGVLRAEAAEVLELYRQRGGMIYNG